MKNNVLTRMCLTLSVVAGTIRFAEKYSFSCCLQTSILANEQRDT